VGLGVIVLQLRQLTTDYYSRVCEVVLHGDKTFSLRQQKYKVSESLKTGEATELFGLSLSTLSGSPPILSYRY